MGQFVHIICNSSYWYHTEASWPFISKVKASWCNLGALTCKQAKIDKFDFFHVIVTKYMARQVIWVNLFTLYVIHHIGITQRPHYHLFQMSRHHGGTWVHRLISKQKSTNLIFCYMIVTKCITRQFLWVNLFTVYVIHHIGITQSPHDHLFQKSRHLGGTWVHRLVSKQKSTNLIFSM